MSPLVSLVQPSARLRQVLLGHLQAEGAFPWPGSDGLTVDEVLTAFYAARLGCEPGLARLCRQHPDLAGELALLFAVTAPPPAGREGGDGRFP